MLTLLTAIRPDQNLTLPALYNLTLGFKSRFLVLLALAIHWLICLPCHILSHLCLEQLPVLLNEHALLLLGEDQRLILTQDILLVD